MEYLKVEEEGDQREPVSPTGQFLNSEALSLCILGVLELGVPISIDESQVDSLVKEVFLPTNPRFSSIMVLYFVFYILQLLMCQNIMLTI